MSHWASTWAYEQDIQPCGRKFVLVALAGFADEDGFCYPSQETLATMTGQTDRSVRSHLAGLEKDGIIQRKHRRSKTGQRTSDGYTLNAPVSRLKPNRKNDPVAQPESFAPENLSADLSENRFDPSVKKEPPKSPKKNYKPPVEIVVGPPPPYTGEEFLRQLSDFEANRKKLKCPLNELSRVRIYSKLAKFAEEIATQALDESITHGWKGVFPEKVHQNGNGHDKPDESRWMNIHG